MQHKSFEGVAAQGLNLLFVGDGAQGGNSQGLGFSPGEQG